MLLRPKRTPLVALLALIIGQLGRQLSCPVGGKMNGAGADVIGASAIGLVRATPKTTVEQSVMIFIVIVIVIVISDK